MGIFKKTIKYSKPSVEIDSKIQELDEGLKKTQSSLPDQSLSTEEIDQILSEEITDIQNWREIFDEETVSEYENQIQEIRERHNNLIKVQGSIEHVKTKEVHQIFNELYQGEVEKVVDNYVSKYSSDIINLREDLFHEIKKRPTVDLKILEDKINLLTVKYNQLSEGLLDDPVTDLNDSISFKQLKDHYQLLVGKLQEQLATLGGGGEVRLQYLDDIVGIATNPSEYNGKYLRYNHSLRKFEFVSLAGGGSGISYTDLTVQTNAVGTAALSYDDTSGVFSYTPPDVSDFVTSSDLGTYATESYVDNEIAALNLFSGDYNDLTNRPINVDDLVNNVGFITSGALSDYATETYVDTSLVGFITTGGSASELLDLTGASAGTYGDGNTSAQVTVDSNGRITSISEVAILGVGTADVRTNSLVVSGVSTFQDSVNLGVAATATGTFFADQLSVSGISTFNDITISSNEIGFSTEGELYITNSNASGTLILSGRGGVEIGNADDEPSLRITNNAVELLHGQSSSKKLETTSTGVIVTGIATATSFSGNGNDIVHSTWTLGANGSDHYTFTGPGGLSTTDDPKIYLARGQTYEFVNNSGGSHPFQIRQSNGGSAYNTGVTNNGASSGTIRFEVPFSAPNTLYYQCTNHVGMGNTIIVYPDLST